jgi:hypothetical protein
MQIAQNLWNNAEKKIIRGNSRSEAYYLASFETKAEELYTKIDFLLLGKS